MRLPAAVIVHGRSDIDRVLAHGRPVTLLSAPGAGIYGGCLWWRALVGSIRDARPGPEIRAVLDCADASGQALAAIRTGLDGLVLYLDAPGRERVAVIAANRGILLLDRAPPALDMGSPGAQRRLDAWLQERAAAGDSCGSLR
jgi:hypothetical protein